MNTKIATDAEDKPTPAQPETHDCCGGASTAEPASKASKRANPAVVERSMPSAAVETGCCCSGGKTGRTGPKR